jgi:hypothetical protein
MCREGTAGLQGAREQCRKHGLKLKAPVQGHDPNSYYRIAKPTIKTNSKNKSHIDWGDNRNTNFTSLNQMCYIPHASLEKGTEENQWFAELDPIARRKLYNDALQRVGPAGAHAVEEMMKDKLHQRSSGGSATLRSAFKYFDRDSSGTIDFHEFSRAIEFMGVSCSHDQVMALFGTYDTEDSVGVRHMWTAPLTLASSPRP